MCLSWNYSHRDGSDKDLDCAQCGWKTTATVFAGIRKWAEKTVVQVEEKNDEEIKHNWLNGLNLIRARATRAVCDVAGTEAEILRG